MANNAKNKKNNKRYDKREDKEKKQSATGSKGANGKDKSDNSAKSGETKSTASALLQSAAAISFPTTAGHAIDLAEPSSVISRVGNNFRIPGVMTFGFMPTPGVISDWSSPFNVWLRDIYTYIRHQNSGHSNYDAANLGQYFLSYDGCMLFLAWMRRMIGLVTGASVPQNAYTPRDIVTAAGGDYDDLVRNLAQLRTYANLFAVRLNAVKVPDLNFFGSHDYLVENVFRDADIAKCSYYVFNPDAVWTYHLGDTPEESYMEAWPMCEGNYSAIVGMGEFLLNNLLNSEDFNIMSGDIMKAYSTYVTPKFTEVDYAIAPTLDPFILVQIHNANVLYQSKTDAANAVREWRIKENMGENANAGALWFNPTFAVSNSSSNTLTKQAQIYACGKTLLDLPVDQPGPGDVALACRFKTSATMFMDENNRPTFMLTSYGTEVITSCSIAVMPGTVHTMADLYLGEITQFDFHPFVPRFTILNSEKGFTVSGGSILGDVSNVTSVPHSVLANIHFANMLDLFGLSAK